MSYAIPTTSLSGATVGSTGSVSWTNIAQSLGYPGPADIPHLALLNESPCGLQLQFVTGEQVVIPAGGWSTVALNPQCTGFRYQVLYVLNASPIVASLLGTWYAPGEVVPSTPILGNSPIGASVSGATTALQLQGTGQTLALSTRDASLAPNEVALVPAANSTGLMLGALDLTGSLVPGLEVTTGGNVVFDGPVNQYAYAGSAIQLFGTGFPLLVAFTQDQLVTSTASQTLCSYTPLNANALLRLSAYVLLRNSVSGNSIALSYSYTDPGAATRTGSLVMQGGGGTTNTLAATGTNSFSNTVWAGTPALISCKAGTTVTISYRDPTNVPNDLVSATIERLT